MMQFKACPRCRGDLELERNEVGELEAYCVQCDFRTFSLVSVSKGPSKREAVRANHETLTHKTKPRVPGDRRSRRGGVHRRVLAGV